MSVFADSLQSPEEGGTPSPDRCAEHQHQYRIFSSSSDPLTSPRSPRSDNGTAAERLTDDLLLEILSRVPAKSLCRFKCVSSHWLGLIDHPDHRKNLPQTLAGFFYTRSTVDEWVRGLESPVHFASVSGRRRETSFAFLSNRHPRLDLLHCCNGLLLGCWYDASNQGNEFGYVVFNPANEKWVALPSSDHSEFIRPRLGFDPAFSPHFHVFEWVDEQDFEWESDEREDPDLAGVAVYSSETGEWAYKEKTWNQHIRLTDDPATVFLNGYLHFLADDQELSDCLAVRSQGRLNYANFRRDEDGAALRLAVYVLENYQSREWILTHSVETSYLFGGVDVQLDVDFCWIAIHPDCNLVFFTVGCDNTLVCYNMDRRQVKVISNLEGGNWRYLPYVPSYAELQLSHP
ncbi:F-box protein At5g07610-like [Lolium rigidum]|uniref:F-box protein At5g07610-like n=1 Tax=Lolium rigidum TaxID=89674 RepID=UPI001F5D5948|nr:F-box protein At5g07610-like [Lolium rigidum]